MSNIHGGELLPLGWLMYTTGDGRPYFYNRTKGITQWDPPKDDLEPYPYETSNKINPLQPDTPLESNDMKNFISPALDVFSPELNFSLGENALLSDKTHDNFVSMEGEISGLFNTPSGVPVTSRSPDLDPKSPPSKFYGSGFWFFGLDTLKPFFDVDTSTVLMRVKRAVYIHELVNVYRHKEDPNLSGGRLSDETHLASFDEFKLAPDFYGPFWITTSLIVALFVCSHVSRLFSHPLNFNADYSLLVIFSALAYGCLLGIPITTWSLKFIISDPTYPFTFSFSQLFTTYGYSLCSFIVFSLLLILPYTSLRWVALLCSFFFSSLFIFLCLKRDLENSSKRMKITLLSVMLGLHFFYHCLVPLYYS